MAFISHPTELRPRFRFRPEKAAEAIEVIARAKPGVTQYFVGKILYLADKAHFLDWGRPITFDRYVAMKHGPVPSAIRNMLITAAGRELGIDEERVAVAQTHANELIKHVRVELEVQLNGERQRVFPISNRLNAEHLSQSDLDCLATAIADGGSMDFSVLRGMTHKDEAWQEAWSRAQGRVAEIDVTLWAPPGDREAYRQQLLAYGADL
jgi:uncharacterized phage-associated protein